MKQDIMYVMKQTSRQQTLKKQVDTLRIFMLTP